MSFPNIIFGLTAISILSILIGNLLALKQKNLKRLLAYSSIAHFGYLLIALVAAGKISNDGVLAIEPGAYYIIGYILATLIATSIITILSSVSEEEKADLCDISGLFWTRPLLALGLTTALLSLAGIPLTAGFIGQLYIFQVGVESAAWILLSALIIGSGLGIYYYLRLIFSMTLDTESSATFPGETSITANLTVLLLTMLVLVLGIYPQPLIEYLLSTL